jgi:hypothetical protein
VHALKITVYLTDVRDQSAFIEAWNKFFACARDWLRRQVEKQRQEIARLTSR